MRAKKMMVPVFLLTTWVTQKVTFVLFFQMTSRLDMYAKSLTEAIKPDYKQQIIHDEA